MIVESMFQEIAQIKKDQNFIYALGFSKRKKAILSDFVYPFRVISVTKGCQIPSGNILAIWGSADIPNDMKSDIQIIRVEDGFIRSIGLGADLIKPVSWVFDTRGIYYDCTRSSDLEFALQTMEFSAELLARSKAIRVKIVENEITKYNVGKLAWSRPSLSRTVVLVPGQVEADASIKYGSPVVKRNIDLLKEVRDRHPHAYIVYKPHPDVLAGLRQSGEDESSASKYSDEIVLDASMGQLLSAVDEVHVMTSLTGFEALLRGKKVVCYGNPFYSGWSMTSDIYPIERRSRVLNLDELVAATLLLYPSYISPGTGKPTSAEQALDELLAKKIQGLSYFDKFIRPQLRRFYRIWGIA